MFNIDKYFDEIYEGTCKEYKKLYTDLKEKLKPVLINMDENTQKYVIDMALSQIMSTVKTMMTASQQVINDKMKDSSFIDNIVKELK